MSPLKLNSAIGHIYISLLLNWKKTQSVQVLKMIEKDSREAAETTSLSRGDVSVLHKLSAATSQ